MRKFIRVLLPALLAAQGAAAATPASTAADQAKILAQLHSITAAYAKLDAVGAMAPYLPSQSFVIFDVMQPPEQHGYANSLRVTQQVIAGAKGPIVMDYQNPTIVVDGNHAYSWDLVHMVAQMKSGITTDMVVRNSDVWQRIHGKWLIIFEHNSLPLSPAMATAKVNMPQNGAALAASSAH